MGYRSLAECVRDLERTKRLISIDQEVDPYLEVAAIQRRVYQAGGPALLFRRAKGRRSHSWATYSERLSGPSICFATHSSRYGGWSSSRLIRARWPRTRGDIAACRRRSGDCCRDE